jgi:hypothetical protein
MKWCPGEAHRLLSAPLALSANVFTSLTADEFTVNGPKVSTILSTLLQRLGSLQRLYSPPQVTMGGVPVHIDVIGGFEAV